MQTNQQLLYWGLADVGTNNFIPGSQARANFPYNGIDFPQSRPTGRFSNGFNSADVLGWYTSSTSKLYVKINCTCH